MLRSLRVRHLAILKDVAVEFDEGLNVLTGETGAGKSLLVGALGLAAGDRADASLLRAGENRAWVEAVFHVEPQSAAAAWLEQRGLPCEDGMLIVRREISAGGGSRVFVNDSAVTVGALRELGQALVELHGQHEHQSLLSAERHLELLDTFGGLESLRQRVAGACDEVQRARRRLDELRAEAAARESRMEALRGVIEAVRSVAPRPGELEEIMSRLRASRHAGRVREALGEALDALREGEPAAVGLAARAERAVARLEPIWPETREWLERVASARVELEDVAQLLENRLRDADFDPGEVEALESRRVALERLLARYGPNEEAALAAADEASEELERLAGLEAVLEDAARALGRCEAAYAEAARELSRARRRAARRLAPAVEEELRALALDRARLEVAWAPAPGEPIGTPPGLPLSPRGVERAEFLWAPNPGEPARPLRRVASGGELSRVMLALHMVLEEAGYGRVLIFDEVDAGVGGAVADAVGARLRRLAGRHQVLCLTHLPQVAAYADRHYRVAKRTADGRTEAVVTELDREARIEELARMLGGRRVSETSRQHAAELLAQLGRSRERRARQRRQA